MSNDIMEPDNKYLVIKKSDLDALSEKLSEVPELQILEMFLALEVPDACVIRAQDIFAPPALDAYVSGIRIALALSKPESVNGVHAQLESIADYFHTRAEQAWHMRRRLPT